jgi:hypothetical protein
LLRSVAASSSSSSNTSPSHSLDSCASTCARFQERHGISSANRSLRHLCHRQQRGQDTAWTALPQLGQLRQHRRAVSRETRQQRFKQMAAASLSQAAAGSEYSLDSCASTCTWAQHKRQQQRPLWIVVEHKNVDGRWLFAYCQYLVETAEQTDG